MKICLAEVLVIAGLIWLVMFGKLLKILEIEDYYVKILHVKIFISGQIWLTMVNSLEDWKIEELSFTFSYLVEVFVIDVIFFLSQVLFIFLGPVESRP